MRKAINNHRPPIMPDEKYNSILISRFINYVMIGGKKQIAKNIVYRALNNAENEMKRPALEIFETAIANVSPILEVKSRRIGGATYQVPVEVRLERKMMLSFRWIIDSARNKQGKSMIDYLTQEFVDAVNKTGNAIKKKEEMHKSAEANKAFAHYSRF